MRVNYKEENGYIVSYSYIPFSESKPSIELNEEDLKLLKTSKCKLINGKLDTSEALIEVINLKNKTELKAELAELKAWFNKYDIQAIQYARHTRLGLEPDIDINALDNEAEIKAKRIKEIEAALQ